MKKIITLLLLSILLFSCKEETKEEVALVKTNNTVKHVTKKIKKLKKVKTYYVGQQLYLKPDSLRVIIIYINNNNNKTYDIDYHIAGSNHTEQYVEPQNFFGYEN